MSDNIIYKCIIFVYYIKSLILNQLLKLNIEQFHALFLCIYLR